MNVWKLTLKVKMTTHSRSIPKFPVAKKQSMLKLQPLDESNESPLFRRRAYEDIAHATVINNSPSSGMSLAGALCSRCGSGFGKDEEIINSNGEVWHHHCFVAAGKPENNGVFNSKHDGTKVHSEVPMANADTSLNSIDVATGNTNVAMGVGRSVVVDEGDEGGYSTIKAVQSCTQCGDLLDTTKGELVNYHGNLWHPNCFVCAQCFRPFPEGVFYEFEGRKYCEQDFNVLFAPCCGRCKEFIIGRVIKAMNMNWHPQCFVCESCSTCLADSGYFRNAGRALCKPCNERENAAGRGKYWCFKCHSVIEEGHIKYKGEAFHPYHYNCTDCGQELTADAREKSGELYCLRCYDKSGIPICGACRRPIDGERIVHALGKAWHVEHFVCAQCEKPFLGTRHYEKKGLAYCEIHYHQLFGNICFVCNNIISGDVFSALNKAWCVEHFSCAICDKKMGIKSKFYEFDLKPTCKGCYDKFPSELKRRLKKAYDMSPKK